jgi:predicted aminopeptidase
MRDNQWAGDKRYDAWINAPLNNARLLPFGLV